MRKLFAATAVCALAVGLTVTPGAVGKTKTKNVASEVSLTASPTTVSLADLVATPITVSGNVKANSSCRKNRTVTFTYNGASVATAPTPVVTGPNGDYTATLLEPTTAGTLSANVLEALRTKTIKGKNKGAGKGKNNGKNKKTKFNCQADVTAPTVTINVSP